MSEKTYAVPMSALSRLGLALLELDTLKRHAHRDHEPHIAALVEQCHEDICTALGPDEHLMYCTEDR